MGRLILHGVQRCGHDAGRNPQGTSDDEIRNRTAELQRIFASDPPAVFLAWETTTRAVSAEFSIPHEPGRDILSSIWQWKPADGHQLAKR